MVLDPNLICGALYRTGDAVATTSGSHSIGPLSHADAVATTNGYTCMLQPLHVHVRVHGCPQVGFGIGSRR